MAADDIVVYKGKSLEELQAMSQEEVLALLPSSIRRKISRGFTEEEQKVIAQFEAGKNNVKTHCRDLVVLPEMVGKKVQIYTGKEFIQVELGIGMIGCKFGELAPTRKKVTHPGGKN